MMQKWTYPDRRPKPGGPWDEEPDKAQWVDEVTGLDCLIVRNGMGALCGYVGVPPEHPWHGKDYAEVDADVHGGLTFAESCDETHGDGPKICHIPAPGRPADVWWFGFDCAHGGDLVPSMRYGEDLGRETYRDFGYVEKECARLAAQLATRRADTGHAGLSLIVPALFGGAMLALAAASGKLGHLVHHLPLTPTPNGFTALCVAVLVGGCWWRLRQVRTAMRELDVHLHNQRPPFDEWWFGTSPFTDTAPDPVPRRRSHPPVAAEDWHPDIAELDCTILPMHPRREQP